MKRSRLHRLFIVLVCLGFCLGFAVACDPAPVEQEQPVVGGSTPEEAVDGFLKTLNMALQDPEIIRPEARQTWAVRLAAYFSPRERDHQQAVIGKMLREFAFNLTMLEANEQLTVEIRYEGVRLLSQEEGRARVRVVDGWLNLRQVATAANGRRTIQRDEGGPLVEMLGMEDDGFPLVERGGRWFLTEYP